MDQLSNRSLERGLRVLETLAINGAQSLAQLHRETDLPKSTIRRLLGTLIARRFVRRSISDRLYRSNVPIPVAPSPEMPNSLLAFSDLAIQHLVDLTGSVQWPTDLHAFDGSAMLIIDSTRPLSPFTVYDIRLNTRVNLFASAAGQACLAKLHDAEIETIFNDVSGDLDFSPAKFGVTLPELLRNIGRIREQGHAFRISRYKGEWVSDDRLAAIACAICSGGRPIGAATLVWPRGALDEKTFAARYSDHLRDATMAIETSLARPDAA